MYFNFDVMYGKNFEKNAQGVIGSMAASFGIACAFSQLRRQYGFDSVITVVRKDDGDSKNFLNGKWPAPSKYISENPDYCSWDNFEKIYRLLKF